MRRNDIDRITVDTLKRIADALETLVQQRDAGALASLPQSPHSDPNATTWREPGPAATFYGWQAWNPGLGSTDAKPPEFVGAIDIQLRSGDVIHNVLNAHKNYWWGRSSQPGNSDIIAWRWHQS